LSLQLTLYKLENPELIEDMLLSYAHDEELKNAYLNLVSILTQNDYDQFYLHLLFFIYSKFSLSFDV